MNKAKQLYELQEIDLDIEHKTETLTQVRGQLGENAGLVSARSALDTARKHLNDLEHQQRTAEWGVEELETKISQEEKKLYEGSTKNPRELINLQKEVDIFKDQRGAREEQLLSVMLEVDTVQRDVTLKHGELDAMEREWQKNQEHLSREQAELEGELAELQQKRELSAEQTDLVSLKVYEGLRQARQRLTVAKVVQGGCQGCRISLPMADQQRARTGQELVTCSNCGRILYID